MRFAQPSYWKGGGGGGGGGGWRWWWRGGWKGHRAEVAVEAGEVAMEGGGNGGGGREVAVEEVEGRWL